MNREDFRRPWRLVQNQVRSPGGYAMDVFRGRSDPKDIPNGSEAWIGSVTRANGATKDCPNYGCAEVILPDGTKKYLFEAIADAPASVLGEGHIEKYGSELGMLVKLLDAKQQYFLQAHPTRPTAGKLWNSSYGKEECWYVISVRENMPEPPYILLGFREGVTRERFETLYRTAGLPELEALCHKIEVKPGEAYFVPGGCPHALGAGCLVAEIQEPSDLVGIPVPQETLLDFRRKAAPNGVFTPVDDALYEKRMLGSFVYEGCSRDEILARCKSAFPVMRSGEGWTEREVFVKSHTAYFSCSLCKVDPRGGENGGRLPYDNAGGIAIGVVLGGEGRIVFPGGELEVRRGDELFFPHDTPDVFFTGNMSVILCRPG